MKSCKTIKPLSALPICFVLMFSAGTLAKDASVKYSPEITLQPNTLNHRVCLYGGKEYSLGAILVVEGVVLECKPENDSESNGRLKWHKVKKK